MDRVQNVDSPLVICEDCGMNDNASVMVRLASAWLCRDCWRIDPINHSEQEAGK